MRNIECSKADIRDFKEAVAAALKQFKGFTGLALTPNEKQQVEHIGYGLELLYKFSFKSNDALLEEPLKRSELAEAANCWLVGTLDLPAFLFREQRVLINAVQQKLHTPAVQKMLGNVTDICTAYEQELKQIEEDEAADRKKTERYRSNLKRTAGVLGGLAALASGYYYLQPEEFDLAKERAANSNNRTILKPEEQEIFNTIRKHMDAGETRNLKLFLENDKNHKPNAIGKALHYAIQKNSEDGLEAIIEKVPFAKDMEFVVGKRFVDKEVGEEPEKLSLVELAREQNASLGNIVQDLVNRAREDKLSNTRE